MLRLMKALLRHCFSAVLALCSLGVEPTLRATAEESASEFQLQPLFTRYARTSSSITLNSTVHWFDDLLLQEAEHVDGFSIDLDLTVPLTDRLQLRLFYPAYTEGDAELIPSKNRGQAGKIDFHGEGGVFDYAGAILEYEFLKPETPEDWSLAVFLGYSIVLGSLDAEGPGFRNKYNHQGKAIPIGLKADRALTDRLTFLAQVGGRYHYESDDLHPEGNDVFFMTEASAALIYNPFDKWAYPVLELVYRGDLGSYNSFEIVPELIVPINSNFELKGGLGCGLADDGEDWQARIQATFRF